MAAVPPLHPLTTRAERMITLINRERIITETSFRAAVTRSMLKSDYHQKCCFTFNIGDKYIKYAHRKGNMSNFVLKYLWEESAFIRAISCFICKIFQCSCFS